MGITRQTRRYVRFLLIFGVYGSVLISSLWTAYGIRYDFHVPLEESAQFSTRVLYLVPLQMLVLLWMGQCAGLLSYFSTPDIRRLLYGLALPSIVFSALSFFDRAERMPAQSVLLTHFVLSFGGLCASRMGFRFVRERFLAPIGRPRRQFRRVGIIGAGDVGAALARDFISKRGLGMEPVAFFDDNASKWRSRVHNIRVLGAPELLADPKFTLHMDEVVIAMPSASARRIKEIVALLQRTNRRFTTVPSLDQLASGKVQVSRLRPVEIEDLLGREPITLEKKNIEHYLRDRVVLVTGAGGSIGSELCRQIAQFKPRQLLLLDQSEVQLFQIEQELIESGHGQLIRPFVGDVVDTARMRQVLSEFHPEVIFHAAAHKHVPMLESQPGEAIKNNTFGTAQLAELALELNVDRFVMISTDKAINPTSVMGATKRMAELYVQALHASEPQRTKFMAVRFGNVLGSSGSVVPAFKRQIAAGGPVKVTHPQITRYFMTIPEAVSLVLQSGALGSGGEIFVLDMGKPIRIADLAKQLIELSGFRPGADIEIEYVGLRPGEKLYEELQHRGENLVPTDHPKILRFVSQPQPLNRVCAQFAQLKNCLYASEADELKRRIRCIVPEYTPFIEKPRDSAVASNDWPKEFADRGTLIPVPA